jgi:acyl-CoA synthetase (AMP-forming)/AMP-acid ligase II
MSDVLPPLIGQFDTLAEAFEAAAVQHGDRLAYVDGVAGDGQRLSFAAWYRRADALACALIERGVQPDDVVAIMLPSSIDYAIAFGAIAIAGGIATGINTRLGAHEICNILDRARPRAAFFDPAAFSVPPPSDVAVLKTDELPLLCTSPGLGARRPPRRAFDPVVIIWTSGTTGAPKGAWFDHRNLYAAVASAGVISRPYDVKLVGTPFAHAGYMAKIWDQLAWGTTSVIAPTPWSASDMLRLIVDERITVAGGVPTQWSKLLDEPAIGATDLSHVRIGLVATAPASPELVERVAARIGCPLVVRYAMTESPSITGTEPDDEPEVQFHTVGRPQAGMQIEMVDEAGSHVAVGSVGRIRVRGECVMRGYWRDPETTAEVLDADGWLTSSDLGRIREDGNIVLVGRTSDMYIRGGYNVHPLEVENVLAEHTLVDRVAVVGLATPVIGQIGVAFVVPAESTNPPTLDDLRAWVRDRLADYKAPDRLVVVDALPQTAMMKIDKVALERLASEQPDTSRRTRTN